MSSRESLNAVTDTNTAANAGAGRGGEGCALDLRLMVMIGYAERESVCATHLRVVTFFARYII